MTRRPSLVPVRPLLGAAVAVALILAAGSALAAPGIPETRVLPNGLRVVLLEDHAVPLTSVSLWVGSGSKFEVEASTGYAHFLEHMIQRGTDTTGPFAYTRLAHRWGGALAVRSNYDRTSITFTGVPQTLGDMIDGAAGMGLHASIKDPEIDLELGTLTQEIRTYYDLPASVAFLETMRTAFDDHPYRWPTLGNFRSVGTLKSEQILAFYRNLYVPNNMALAVAGDFEPRAAMARIEAAFGGASISATLPTPPGPPATLAGHIDVEKRLDFGENWTTLSFVGPGYRHPDRAAFDVLAAALADPSSGLAAAVQSGQTATIAQVSYYGLEETGLLYVALNPATPELSYTAAAAATRALAAFKTAGIGEAALRERTARMVRDERARAASVQERAERLGESVLFGGPRYYWDRPDALRSLTPADIARVARHYLVSENMRLVVLVPKATGDLPEPSKEAFHKALDGLGAAGGNLAFGLQATLYDGDDAQRPDPAAWGNPKGSAAPRSATTTTLKNGMTVVVVEDHRWPVAAASLHLRGGSEMDPAGREGAAAIALRMIAGRTVTALRGAAAAAARPAAVIPEAQVMRDALEVRFTGDTADLGSGLAALARAVRDPLPAGDIEPARQAALFSLQRAHMDPDGVALDLFHEKAFAGHPYAHRPDGTPAGLRAITTADIAAFGAAVLRPGGAVVAIVGDIDGAAAVREVVRQFGDWKGEGGPTTGRHAAPPADGAPAGDAAAGDAAKGATAGALPGGYSRQMSTAQSRIVAGVPGVRADDPEFAGLRAIGAGVTLLAFDDMVFKRRAAFSAVSIPEGLREGGTLAVALTTQPSRSAEALFDVQRLLRRMAVEPLADDDVRDIGRVLNGREAAEMQVASALASTLAWRVISGTAATAWRSDLARTVPDAQRLKAIAEARLRPENLITIVVGPPTP